MTKVIIERDIDLLDLLLQKTLLHLREVFWSVEYLQLILFKEF